MTLTRDASPGTPRFHIAKETQGVTDTNVVTQVSLVAVVLIVWGIFQSRHGSALLQRIAAFEPSKLIVRLALLAVVPLYGAQIAVLVAQARLENTGLSSSWARLLPIPIYDGRTQSDSVHLLLCSIAYTIAALESLAVAYVALGVYRRISDIGWRLIALISLALGAMSFVAPAMSTTDPYEYVASGLLGMKAYAPTAGAFKATIYESIYPHIPMRGVVYGPLWLAIDTAVTFFGSTIYLKLLSIRAMNVVLTFGLIALLARARASRAALVACSINPAIWFYNVLNPHAEIECLVALASAYVFAQRKNAVVATAFVIVAGTIKLPFIVAGAAVFAPISSARLRITLWAVAIGAALAVSYAVPGNAYLRAIIGYTTSAREHSRALNLLYIVPLCGVVIAMFVVRKKNIQGAAWLFGQLAPLSAPWYLLWGFPYAMATNTLTVFLVLFPIFAAMLEDDFNGSSVPAGIVIAVLCAFMLDVLLLARDRRAKAQPHV